MTALVLGGAGFIGERLVRYLTRRGLPVVVFDNFHARRSFDGWRAPVYERRREHLERAATVVEGDVRDVDAVARAVREHRPGLVYFLSALVASEAVESATAAAGIQVDALATTLDVLDRELPAYRFVHASSSFVYGDFVRQPADEEHPLRPVELYGELKLESERVVASRRWNGSGWMILRPSAVYGVGDSRTRNAGPMVEAVAAGRPVTCYEDGTLCDFTYVDDAARAFAACADGFRTGAILNVTAGGAATYGDFCAILRELEPSAEIAFERWEGVSPSRGAVDSRRAGAVLGWRAEHRLRDGIARTLAEAREVYGTA